MARGHPQPLDFTPFPKPRVSIADRCRAIVLTYGPGNEPLTDERPRRSSWTIITRHSEPEALARGRIERLEVE